ncbi:MAG: hypothetical protein ACD_12C00515G0005 [uncultured bacterium]|nr:MAG: hypothetical protein ACD_12C00515G0005 [uncultured bacterium]
MKNSSFNPKWGIYGRDFYFSKSKIFLMLCLGFILGVGLRSYFEIPFFGLYLVLLLILVILIFSWQKRMIRVFVLFLGAVILGVIRFQISLPINNETAIHYYNDKDLVTFTGVVSAEPDQRKDQVKLTVSRVIKGNRGIRGKVLVTTDLYPEYKYGDELEISCKLKTPELIEDFAYDKYLARYDIYSLCYYPDIELISYGNGNFFYTQLYRLKAKFVSVINQTLSEPQASFMGGLLLGARKGIPEDLMEAFNKTGTTHIIAISGFNITIICVLMMKSAQAFYLPRRLAFLAILGTVLFFILITGAPASIIRAGIMGMLVLLAQNLGRISKITNALILACLVMILINPKVLVFDVGFQLSFLSTMGLIYLSPILEKGFKFLPNFLSIRESLSATMAAIIFTLPLILFNFGRISLIAPLANILILPFIPLSMALGFIMTIFGLIWLPLGQAMAWGSWLSLSYIIQIEFFLSKLNFASINLPKIHWLMMLGIYLIMIGLLFFIKKKTKYLYGV